MNDYIEQLARQKSFAELDPDEREAVLAVVSPETYEQTRAILLAAPRLDEAQGPPPALRDRLTAQMAAEARRSQASRGLHRSIPLWQAAAALLAGVALTAWLRPAPAVVVVQQVPERIVETRTDTVFVREVQWKERIVVREKVVFRDAPAAAVAVLAPQASPALPAVAPFQAAETPLGTSLASEPALLDFFIQVK